MAIHIRLHLEIRILPTDCQRFVQRNAVKSLFINFYIRECINENQ